MLKARREIFGCEFNQNNIKVGSANSMSISSSGTSSEHNVLYQYQFAETKNIYMGQIQTESACVSLRYILIILTSITNETSRYYQPNPVATTPFPVVSSIHDPDFKTSCSNKGDNCAEGWGLRVLDSTGIFVYGAGLYSFFDNNDACKYDLRYDLVLHVNNFQHARLSIPEHLVKTRSLVSKARRRLLSTI